VLLLEADPEELAGTADSALARHVAGCASCRAIARAIQEDTAALDRYLTDVPRGPDVDVILASAGYPAGSSTRVIRFPRWRRWSALAAAAAVAGLLLGRPDAPMPGSPFVQPDTPPLVEAAPDQNVAVMATADPDITVLWFF
jgi:hypothetical protein